jgi:hypothetical protein
MALPVGRAVLISCRYGLQSLFAAVVPPVLKIAGGLPGRAFKGAEACVISGHKFKAGRFSFAWSYSRRISQQV